MAFVVGDVTAEEVDGYCRGQLASIKTPRKIVVVEALSKSALHKTIKRASTIKEDNGRGAST